MFKKLLFSHLLHSYSTIELLIHQNSLHQKLTPCKHVEHCTVISFSNFLLRF